MTPGSLLAPDPRLPSQHPSNVLTSAGLVIQGTPEQDGVHQLLLCLCSLKGFSEGQVGDLGAEGQGEERAQNSPAPTGVTHRAQPAAGAAGSNCAGVPRDNSPPGRLWSLSLQSPDVTHCPSVAAAPPQLLENLEILIPILNSLRSGSEEPAAITQVTGTGMNILAA